MKAYVITIMDNPESVRVADRCIKSAAKYGISVEKFPAITPDKDPIGYANKKNIPIRGFEEVYSRYENCISAFLSHFSLWERCVKDGTTYMILEHDAVFVDQVNVFMNFDRAINIGQPSYGKARRPMMLGVNPLTSKQYFPGAHAYMIKPAGAAAFISRAGLDAGPTDVFLHKERFPWLEEYYPWPVQAKDTFTTIQNVEGCQAKHRFNNEYKII
jgi:GR25 family glycosyltransferase involved in LPS biosynthesis